MGVVSIAEKAAGRRKNKCDDHQEDTKPERHFYRNYARAPFGRLRRRRALRSSQDLREFGEVPKVRRSRYRKRHPAARERQEVRGRDAPHNRQYTLRRTATRRGATTTARGATTAARATGRAATQPAR
jgi:hypothetical protein